MAALTFLTFTTVQAEKPPWSQGTPHGDNKGLLSDILPTQSSILAAARSKPYEEAAGVVCGYRHGITLSRAMAMEKQHVEQLWGVVANRDLARCWPIALQVLALHHRDDTAARVVAFIEDGISGPVDAWEIAGITHGLRALGLIVQLEGHRGTATDAFEYLVDSTDAGAWGVRGIAWFYRGGRSRLATHVELAREALRGLALSGQEAAIDHLISLQSDPNVGDRVQQEVELLLQIQVRGLTAYFSP